MQPNENHPHYQLHPESPYLYRGRVQHDTNRSTERLSGKRGSELGADDARVAWREDDVSLLFRNYRLIIVRGGLQIYHVAG